MSKPLYKRVLVKLSGEILNNPEKAGLVNAERLRLVAAQIQSLVELGVQVGVVIGGGNIIRGASAAQKDAIDRVTGDHMGMLATVINSLALMDTLEKMAVPVRVMSAIPMDRLAEPYIQRRAVHHLEKGRIVILAAGTGNPYFSTDTAAALRASEIGAELLIKATKVDGVYSADPKTNPSATKYEKLSFDEAIEKRLEVLDATAFTMCRENAMPVAVVNLMEEGSLAGVVKGEKIGTLVSN